MTRGNNSRRGCVGRSRVVVTVAVLLALTLFVPSLGTGVRGVSAQPDCGNITFAEYPDSLGVQNVEQLQCMTSAPSANYTLRQDINASGTEEWNNGKGFDPVGASFRGSFDGRGHSIRGLTIDRPNESNVGLFASTSEGVVVENVELERVDITGNEVVGGLVGENQGEVRNATVSGVVTGERNVGGLVGFNVGGVVTRTFSTADVTANSRNTGGLVGRNTGEVSQSYTDGVIRGDTTMGGVVGYNLGDVRDTYSTSNVNGGVIVGGIVGENRGDSRVSASYSAGNLRGTSEVRGAVGLNTGEAVTSYFEAASVTTGSPGGNMIGTSLATSEMTGENAELRLEGFDFDETWATATNPDGYPALSWQTNEKPVYQQGASGGSTGEGTGRGGDGDGEDEGTDGGTDGGTNGGATDDGTDSGTGNETDGGGTDGSSDEADDGAADGDADGETGDGTGGEDADSGTGDGTGDGEDMPGFGPFAAVAALLVGALVLSRRSGSGEGEE